MTKELKSKWIEALRSGTYKQGQYRLRSRTMESWCCLGVLCDLIPDGTWEEDGNFRYGVMRCDVSLPESLKHDVGISLPQLNTLVELNDGKKKMFLNRSFDEIADWIETNIIGD